MRKLLTLGGLALLLCLGACKKGTGSGLRDDNSPPSTTGGGVEGQMSQDMRDFRDKFVTMQTSDDVAAELKSLNDKTQSGAFHDNDIKLVAAQLIPLIKFRGISYRMKKIVEQFGGKTFHSIIVTSMMQVATGSRIFKPTDSSQGTTAWRAINHYLNDPYPGMAKVVADERAIWSGQPSEGSSDRPDPEAVKFVSVAEFQAFLDKIALPDLSAAIDHVNGIALSDSQPIVWDNQIIYGRDSFGNDTDLKDRFVTIRDPERQLILAGLYSMRHNLYFFNSFDFEKLPALVQSLGRLVGFDGLLGDVTGMSARDRAQVICPNRGQAGNSCEGQFATLFTRKPEAARNMPLAFADLQASVQAVKTAWNEVQGQQHTIDDFQLLDPAKILPWTRVNQETINNLDKLLAGQQVRNAVTGKLTQVNVQAFYQNPPDDLKKFMPVAFDSSPRMMPPIDIFSDARNFEFGESTGWDASVYNPYFPDVKNGTEVPVVMKDLAQAWGGWLANTPLATVSMVF